MRVAIICSQISESIIFKQAALTKKLISKIEKIASSYLRSLRLSYEIILSHSLESFADGQHPSNTFFLRLMFDGATLAQFVFAVNKSAISYFGSNCRYNYALVRQHQEKAKLRRGRLAQITTSSDDSNIIFVVEQTQKQRLKTEVFYVQGSRKFAAECAFFDRTPWK